MTGASVNVHDLALKDAIECAKMIVENRPENQIIETHPAIFLVRHLRVLIDAAESRAGGSAGGRGADLLEQLGRARQQNEHMLATIRRLYEDMRAEQTEGL
jgi:hypothetical protein